MSSAGWIGTKGSAHYLCWVWAAGFSSPLTYWSEYGYGEAILWEERSPILTENRAVGEEHFTYMHENAMCKILMNFPSPLFYRGLYHPEFWGTLSCAI